MAAQTCFCGLSASQGPVLLALAAAAWLACSNRLGTLSRGVHAWIVRVTAQAFRRRWTLLVSVRQHVSLLCPPGAFCLFPWDGLEMPGKVLTGGSP